MKSYYLLTIVSVVILLSSCKKESLSSTALNSAASATTSQAALTTQSKAPVITQYGAYIGAPPRTYRYDFEMSVADQLGISCLRENVKVPAVTLDGSLVPQLNSRYKIVLTFLGDRPSGIEPGTQISFRTDTVQYKKDLNMLLNTFKVMPVVASIENEEANRLYYIDYAKNYIIQLRAAIRVMHARGIKVANGGLTSQGLDYLVYQDFVKQGKYDSAQQFQLATGVQPDSLKTQDRGAFTDTLLRNFRKMDLNYVNFHRKANSRDTLYLHQIVNYLKKRTGKKIISNELGQMDYDPNTLLDHLKLCDNQHFPYVLWYSPDQDAGKRGTPLQYPDGTLTPSGIAYKNYLVKP